YIDQEDDTIVLTCPRVAAGQYLSVLASFPVEWLSDVTPQTEERLDTIMDMGAEVANTANEARATARLINYGSTGVAGVLSLGSILFAALKFRKYGKEHKAVFSDEYWRDMPSDDHPAVIGSLYRWGALADEDLAATLMKLTHEGVVKLDRVYVTKTGLLGREGTKEDYMLTLDQEKFENLTNKIDIAAVKLLFKTVSAGRQAKGGLTEASYADSRGVLALDKNHICFSEVASCAKEDAEQYKKRFDKWKKSIADAAESKNFYEPEGEAWHNRFIGVGIVMFVLAILVLVFTFDVFPIWVSIILFVASITVFVLGINMRRRSREANEIHAKTEALRRWLLDFTNLKEAIPQDVVLWDKLLVMATVLGVSQEVVDQLRVSAPYILESPEVAPIYMWYYPWGNMNMASTALAETTSEANMLSSQALAATADSSVGGGSGGFGGGGFGGSFGGGSFGGGGFGAR
ncbi:MAG: DUF2207 domain-containing protein, partial [Coriobacteriales bacterium]|nr:DUF2207 domain-containing protein [Coriobacteriales bacterium]